MAAKIKRRARGDWTCECGRENTAADAGICGKCHRARPWERSGLHRLDCPRCAGYTYSTVANLETVGLPKCACGETFQPERIDLAHLLGLEHVASDDIARDGYNRELSQIRKYGGQQRVIAHWEGAKGKVPANMYERALDAFRAEERARARARRLSALRPVTSDPIPF